MMKSLVLQVLKIVTLGRRMNGCLYPSPISDSISGGTNDQPAHPAAQATSGEREDQPAYPAVQATSGEREVESRNGNGNVKDDKELQSVEATASKKKEPEPTIAPQAKAPEKVVSIKKTVSINDRVEEIDKIMKVRKKRKSLEQLNSLQKEENESKPLRSILKVGSNLDDNADTCVNQTTNQ